MKKVFKKITKGIKKRKKLSIFLLVVILGGGYLLYGWVVPEKVEVSYVTEYPTRGMITSYISGTGQVFASTEMDLKPKASGEVTVVGVKSGEEVKAGTLLLRIDSEDAAQAVRDAEANLQSALISYKKLTQPADTLSLIQAEHSLAQAKESKESAEYNLGKSYEDGFNYVSNAFLDLPDVMSGLQDILYGTDLGESGQWNLDYYTNRIKEYDENWRRADEFREDANEKYILAREAYTKSFDLYKATSRFSSEEEIESVIVETYDTTKIIAEAVKSANNLVQLYTDVMVGSNQSVHTKSVTHLSSLSGYTSKINSHLLNLLSASRSIEDNKESIVNSDRSISEKTESLTDLKAGADELDIEAQELTITQRKNALQDARNTFSDYFIYAPFDGIVASVDVKKGDEVSASSVPFTFITKEMVAEITLNEVEIAKVKEGQKVTLTFDAIDDFSATGHVVEVDTLGEATGGVVSYGVKIGLDMVDERIKSGMSVNASIITDMKTDTLIVQNSAVKSLGDRDYVEVLNDAGGVERKIVTLGIAGDLNTEITSGISEEDAVIVQTRSNGEDAVSTEENMRDPSVGGMMRMVR